MDSRSLVFRTKAFSPCPCFPSWGSRDTYADINGVFMVDFETLAPGGGSRSCTEDPPLCLPHIQV